MGGIASAEDALEKLEAGATPVQVYSVMVYAEPAGLVREICEAIKKNGLDDNIQAAENFGRYSQNDRNTA